MGENDGDRVETASTIEPLTVTCRDRASESITSTVSGRALAGRMVRVAVTTSWSTLVTSAFSSAWVAVAAAKASRLRPARAEARRAPLLVEMVRMMIDAPTVRKMAPYSC